jgi:hypothetical protein
MWEENPRYSSNYRDLVEELYPDDVRFHKILLYDMADAYKRVPLLLRAEIEMRRLDVFKKTLIK